MENPYGFGGYFSHLMGGQSVMAVPLIAAMGIGAVAGSVAEIVFSAGTASRDEIAKSAIVGALPVGLGLGATLKLGNKLQKARHLKQFKKEDRLSAAAAMYARPMSPNYIGRDVKMIASGVVAAHIVDRAYPYLQSRGRSGVVMQTQMTRVRRDSKRRPSALKRNGNRCPNGYRYDPKRKMCVLKK